MQWTWQCRTNAIIMAWNLKCSFTLNKKYKELEENIMVLNDLSSFCQLPNCGLGSYVTNKASTEEITAFATHIFWIQLSENPFACTLSILLLTASRTRALELSRQTCGSATTCFLSDASGKCYSFKRYCFLVRATVDQWKPISLVLRSQRHYEIDTDANFTVMILHRSRGNL
jgi:hypothetical protein